MNNPLSELANYLSDQQEALVERWVHACEADDALGVVSKLTRTEFHNNIPLAIEGLCRVLSCGSNEASSETIKREVAKHGHERWKQGFSLEELIRDWGHLNRVLVAMTEAFFEAHYPQAPAERAKALDRVAAFIIEATGYSVQRFDALRRAEAAALARDLEIVKTQFDQLTQVRGQLLREAVHDIRGGLSAIESASAVLKLSQEPNKSFTEVLEVLSRSVDSVKEMLNSLLDLSRLESGADPAKLLSVNIVDVLESLAAEYHPVAAEKGLKLSTEGPKEVFVQTDPEKVRRIAQNLLLNALEHTSQGEIRLSWKVEAQRWVMCISDTGLGLQSVLGSPMAQELNEPDSDLDCQPSSPYSYAGEGIGLTIVKRLCDLLDAGVSLESELSQGTLFTIKFPLGYPQSK
ncbi:sensor histidine kinase [Nitrosococcus wardiae]|uniref:histidine kinase n=1 Tax=Nitrosococcus wardiae TaxID=1814290 RepID=A0A4P7BYS0_9GAMM|nr:HAMP domain-containing sensor histidine kinase [Nitrosococcus wardiae]QBQ55338.1 sensor histidine kinase [Nitrosococcus wardiae]